MGQKRRNRVFPYYIIVGVNEKAQTMKILDLNTIQKHLEDKEARVYEENTDLHDIKQISVPGSTKPERDRVIVWMKAMMGDTFMAKKKCMVYNHRAHWTNPIHEEYKRPVFLEWENAQIPELEEETPEEIEEDLEID